MRFLPTALPTLFAAFCLLGPAPPTIAQAEPPSGDQQAALEAFFETKVRPLLVTHCVECHGPDDQSGELRIDGRAHFLHGGASGPLVQGKNVDASRLIRAVRYRDNQLQMPPDSKLPDEAIQTLEQWVRQGAYWPADDSSVETPAANPASADEIKRAQQSHWAYQPITAPAIPDLPQGRFDAATPIDRFIIPKLLQASLQPAPKADKETLLKRASFALIGLPPTYQEVQEFIADDRPEAFAEHIDQLLDDPRYGERWARHWLDLARYGDTMGYLPGSQDERYPFAFTFRDYVIDAFNDDKPYNQFIIEQLAADKLNLQGDDRKALAAMGILTVGRRFMNNRHDIIDDQIDVVTRGFLGLSVACARCHDHKYDAIPTADYYSLYGVMASSQVPGELPLLGDPQPSPQYDAFIKARDAKQAEADKWLEAKRVETENELRHRVSDYLFNIASELPAYKQAGFKTLQGKRGALRPAAFNRWKQYLVNPQASPQPTWELLRQLAALPKDQFAEKSTDLLSKRLQATAGNNAEATPELTRLLTTLQNAKPPSFPAAALIVGQQLEQVVTNWDAAIKADANTTALKDAGLERLRQLLLLAAAPTTLTTAEMRGHFDQGQVNKFNQLKGQVQRVIANHDGAPSRGMVMVDKPKPVEPVIFRRGVAGNRGDRVPRRFLHVLDTVDGGKVFQDGSGRLELARAIASEKNPLTARVIVNRVWQHHFGDGLVRTASDFGVRGQPPTHPALLDHLASSFMQQGWSIKQLQRQIMLSMAWQQTSAADEAALLKDPENRLLWHMPRQRLEFEPLRDRLLFAAGQLDPKVGGRSAMIHKSSTRRSLYAYIDREDFPGLLASFDVPSPDASQAKRAQTTVPQQALYLMNSPFVINQAKALAKRCEPGDDVAAGVKAMYRYTLSRDPSDSELATASAYVTPAPESPKGLSRWQQLAQVLLLSNEFAFVD